QVEFVSLTHSIPEPNGLAIRTPAGLIMHMTDWKIDAEPMVGGTTDIGTLKRLGDEGVLALVCDSTNVFVTRDSQSEGAVREELISLVGDCTGRVAITMFSSNIARILSAIAAAEANGRSVALVGRSIKNMVEAAKETGYAPDLPPFVAEKALSDLPADKVLLIVSGSQGEPRAAMTRVASRNHPSVALDPGDVVIYSSKMIPGNERKIQAVQNDLVRQGVRVVTDKERAVHASGHPTRPELARMYGWLKPQMMVPIHGDTRHLQEHGAFAVAHGIARTLVVESGTMLRFGAEGPEIVDHVPSGRMAVDGLDFVNPDGEIVRARRRLMEHGSAFVVVVLDARGRLKGIPRLSSHGVIEAEDTEARDAILAAIVREIKALPAFVLEDDDHIREAATRALRKTLKALRDKRPVVDVQIIRI
ncbi:MAG: ribonuclease J, partial [Alphaproteobacteria bacterium]|nr:ribonuclease J [Alphaproteobacteria bacterium]